MGVLLFLVLSGLLARFLSVENVERDRTLALLQAQAQGNEQRMLGDLSGCGANPRCVATVRADARSLRGAGAVKILLLKSPTAYSLTGATGNTRVAWKLPSRFPVVQCVLVRRAGNPISGIKVTLLSVSRPIENTADC